jgi:hypothetical protein
MAFNFGLTNDRTLLEAARKFLADAIADGWTAVPGHHSEDVASYAHLSRPTGWKMHVVARETKSFRGPSYEAMVHIWGPDRLSVQAPLVYDRTLIKRGLRVCGLCGASGVETTRYSCAGRCCIPCSKLPASSR